MKVLRKRRARLPSMKAAKRIVLVLILVFLMLGFESASLEQIWLGDDGGGDGGGSRFAPLADRINSVLGAVEDWSDVVDIGIVMHRSFSVGFDAWITSRANVSDWTGVFYVKRCADHAGYSSTTINSTVKLALSSVPMFSKYSLPKTDGTYFWPWDRYVLYGYRYSQELGWETGRWNKTSGFLALKAVRDSYGKAFCKCDPDSLFAVEWLGTRWHQAGSLMDCFFIFHKLGVKVALDYAVQEWNWLNAKLWETDHFNYSVMVSGWEFSGISVFPNVAKLLSETELKDSGHIVTDLQSRYISNLWNSPEWFAGKYRVAVHHYPGNPERRLDGTTDAWIMLNTFYGVFGSQNQQAMKDMLEGNGVTQAWTGLCDSDLANSATNSFRDSSNGNYSSGATAEAALCLFLMGISPQDGKGLAVPLISDCHSDFSSLNYRHFEFDYLNHRIKIPVWGGTRIKFLYGQAGTEKYFGETGIYRITFSSDWNAVFQVERVSDLYSNEFYFRGSN
jgi:hypothetical protein